MSLDQIRLIVRWLALLAILAVVAIAIVRYLPIPGASPPVQLPGGPRTMDGVSPDLDGAFGMIGAGDRLHFVVQFSRELTSREIDDIGTDLGLRLDGPVPEYAYITSTTGDRWATVRDELQARTPPAIKLLDFLPQDKLAPALRDPNDPTKVDVPPYSMAGPDDVAVYVRFFDDVPLADQQDILSARGATQPDGSAPVRGPTGLWAILVPELELFDLASQDNVRFIEPALGPAVEDMDQARGEVGANDVDIDDTDILVSQWERCHAALSHPDLAGRITLVGDMLYFCRPWHFADRNDSDDDYDIDDAIGVDLDEDGTIDRELYPNPGPPAVGDDWHPLPLSITARGRYFFKDPGGNPDIVEVNDIALHYNVYVSQVTPDLVVTPPNNPISLNRYMAGQHPTLVAGIIISDSGSVVSGGSPKYPGMAPGATVASHAWQLVSPITDYTAAMMSGAKISSNSFGWRESIDYPFSPNPDPYNSMSEFYDEVVSGRDTSGAGSGLPARMLVVASAGNRGNHSSFWRTARIINSTKNVISVGNVSSSEYGSPGTGLGVASESSGRGPTLDGRLSPILSAPGSQVKCSDDGGDVTCELDTVGDADGGITSTYPVSAYRAARGTSFSTPIVSGAAALVGEHYEDTCGTAPRPQDLRALLVHTATDLTKVEHMADDVDPDEEFVGPDFVFGYGLVRVDEAAEMVKQAISDELETGWIEHRVFIDDYDQLDYAAGEWQLRVTLVWDDPPYYREYPPREDTGILQNDLDLEVVDPMGNRHLPWILSTEPGDEGTPAERKSRARFLYVLDKWRDHRNTIEQVVVDVKPAMMNRTWKIRVREHKLRRGPQSYTLVSEAFETFTDTDCGEFINGSTVYIEFPLEVPNTPLAWALFWIAVIVLVWLTIEAALWLFQAVQATSGTLLAYLAVIFMILLLYVLFWLLVTQNLNALAGVVLLTLAYVWWRATQP